MGAMQVDWNLGLRLGKEIWADATEGKKEKLMKVFSYFDVKGVQV